MICDRYETDTPVVLAVPHAGRDYPDDIVEALAVPLVCARILEDRHADALIATAIKRGQSALIARVPRLVIDLNRAESDLDHRLGLPVSARARAGIGLLPMRVAGVGDLWRVPPGRDEITRRIEAFHRPYHATLGAMLRTARDRHGAALLIDIHSMPPLPGLRPAQIVIGSRHGASADAPLLAAAANWWRRRGYRIAIDVPYAGAYVLERHAKRTEGIQALQLEVDRRLYLDTALERPGLGLAELQGNIARFASDASAWLAQAVPLAAE